MRFGALEFAGGQHRYRVKRQSKLRGAITKDRPTVRCAVLPRRAGALLGPVDRRLHPRQADRQEQPQGNRGRRLYLYRDAAPSWGFYFLPEPRISVCVWNRRLAHPLEGRGSPFLRSARQPRIRTQKFVSSMVPCRIGSPRRDRSKCCWSRRGKPSAGSSLRVGQSKA